VAVIESKTDRDKLNKDSRPRAKMAKVTVTIPAETLEAAAAEVRSGKAPSLSAYVSKALAAQVAADREGDSYLAFLDALDEELGAPSDADYEWARRFASQ
jgi:hypothetical protein